MRNLMIAAMLLVASLAVAQDDAEYRLELGGGVGMLAYQGDFNGNLLKGMKPMAMLSARYKPNPRMAWALNLGMGSIKGDYNNAHNFYPELTESQRSFSNTVFDGGARFEYNFWPFGTGRDYRGAKPLTPFITLGAGITFADTDGGSVVCANFPIGGGVKYKIAKRVNLTAEWTMHVSTSDKLDGVADPHGIKSSGMFKNKDSYSMLVVGLTYDIWAKCRTCHNDDD